MKFVHPIRTTVLLLSLFIAACGSSTDDSSATDQGSSNSDSNSSAQESSETDNTNPAEGIQIGRFVDSPVAGLDYITSSGMMGKTNTNGEFEYLAGDEVTFKVGELILGTIIAAARITPFDLVGFVLPNANASVADLLQEILALDSDDTTAFGTGVNLLIFLQSLDSNNNPDDGIVIAATVAQYFLDNSVALAFNQSTNNFTNQFVQLFTQLVANSLLERGAGAAPVDRDDAIRHFLFSNATN